VKNAVVLLSGGLDSATVLAIVRTEGFQLHALTLDYGQRHVFELEAARQVAAAMKVAGHKTVKVDLYAFGGSALTGDFAVPKGGQSLNSEEIPITYVPARNTVMLALALAYAETIESDDIFIGVNAVDYSGYPDCRPAFIESFEKLANLATKRGTEGHRMTIHAPLITLSKKEIIQKGLELGVDYAMTHSCYDPESNGRPCGACDACLIRSRAFGQLELTDPALAMK
jgi:7-cyano-7-deazaguanine synthase